MSGGIERTYQRLVASAFATRVQVAWLLMAWLLVGAFWLRWQRFPMRFNQISFAYAAYYEPWQAAAGADPLRGWLHFVGLHPPLYSALVTLVLDAGGGLWGAQLLSGLFSTLGVAGVYAAGRVAGLGRVSAGGTAALATVAVYLLHYGLELNNYPLLFCISSWLLTASLHLSQTPSPRAHLLFVGALVMGVYTHMLMIPLGFLLLLSLLLVLVQRYGVGRTLWKARALRSWLWSCLFVTLLCLPLLRPILEKAGQGSTFQNEAAALSTLLLEGTLAFARRFGGVPLGGLLTVWLLLGMTRWVRTRRYWSGLLVLGAYVLMTGVIVLLMRLGIAASHQLPYFLVAAPGLLLLAGPPMQAEGVSARSGAMWSGFLLVLTAQLAVGAVEVAEMQRQVSSWQHNPLAPRVLHAVHSSDVVWLIAPPRYDDDDKRATDPMYAWLLDGRGCRYWHPVDLDFEYVDYRFGQPMECNSTILFSFTDIYQGPMVKILMYLLSKKKRITVVLYGTEESPDYHYRLDKLLEDNISNHPLYNNIILIKAGAL